MTTNPSTKPKPPAKLTAPTKLLIGALSVSAFIGGWGVIGWQEGETAPTQQPIAQPPTAQPNLLRVTATPWPTIAPVAVLPPIPTVAPLSPLRTAGINRTDAPATDLTVAPALNLAVSMPSLAPLPAMPAPPPPPPSSNSDGGGGNSGGGGGGNSTKGS